MRDVDPQIATSAVDYLREEQHGNTSRLGLGVRVGPSCLVPLRNWIAVGCHKVHETDGGELGYESHEILREEIFLVVVLVPG